MKYKKFNQTPLHYEKNIKCDIKKKKKKNKLLFKIYLFVCLFNGPLILSL